MRTWRILILIIALATGRVLHAEAIFSESDINEAINSNFSGVTRLSTTEGDLDGDGVPDVACVIEWADRTISVVVFRGVGAHLLERWHQSKKISGFQREYDIEIKKGSLFVSEYRNTLSEKWWPTNQYQLRSAKLLLVGSEVVRESPVWDDEPGPKTRAITSTNFLTLREVVTTTIGKRTTTQRRKLQPMDPEILEDLEAL